MADRRFLKLLPLAAVCLAVLAVSGAALFKKAVPEKPSAELPIYARVPDFTLVERSGRTVSKGDLAGRPWVADFIFTRCGGICPMMSSKMAGLTREFLKTQFVSFSVDPEFDSPAVLAEYAKHYEADLERWLFLTGDRSTLNRITTALHMNKIDEPMMHSGSFVLIDSGSAVRGYYSSDDAEALEKLKRDVSALRKEHPPKDPK